MVYLGTSGYSYDDWVGPFYPPGTPQREFFAYYLQHFHCVELNFSYYTQPAAATLERLAAQTAPEFRFTLKAFKDLTLGRSQEPAQYAAFAAGVAPLVERGQLGAVLLQFPNSFRLTRESVDHLRFMREQWPDWPLVVELRHREWVEDERTFKFLSDQQFGFCCVDEPRLPGLLPPMARFTAAPAYVRFHGRNAAKWYYHDEAWERYNYLYAPEELVEWLAPVRELSAHAGDTYLFFNNHYQAKAVQNAQDFAELLAAGPE